MSRNIFQVYTDNPITVNNGTDLMYFGQSPYGLTNNAAMTFANFSAQFGAPYTASPLTRISDTNVILSFIGTPSTALLQDVTIVASWSGTLAGARGGTGIANTGKTINLGSPTTGYVLTSDSSGNATWQAIPASSVTFTGDTGTPFSGHAVTVTGASTGLTFAASTPDLSLGGLLTSTYGGTGVDAPTAHGIMVAEGASPMTPIVLSSGQILIGSTGVDPVAAAINSGTSVLVANGAGSITVGLAAIASNDILSNITAGSAAPIANTLTATIDAAIGSTQGDILYRSATAWTVLPPDTSGKVLTTGGAAANPSWQTVTALNPLTTKGDLFTFTTVDARLPVGATDGMILQVSSGASTGLAWSTATYPTSTTVNQVLYSSSNNVVAGVSAVNSAVMISSAGGVPSFSTTLPSGLTIPGYQTTITPAALTKTNDTNVTLTLGGTPATALLQATSITAGWTGTLSGARGGTGVANTGLTINLGSATTGYVLTSDSSGNGTWQVVPNSSVTFTGDSGTPFSGNAVTVTGGTTGLTFAASTPNLTLGGTLGAGFGGTGLSSITAHNLIVGNGTSAATLLAPSATSGVPLISQGSSSNPAYGTAVVGGGGTGNTTFTAYSVICAGTTAIGAFQNVSGVGTSGQVLTSNGASALPTWQPATGSGTVNSGTAGQLAYYATSTNAVSGGQLGNIAGTTTNDNAGTGNVGEFFSQVIPFASAPTLPQNAATNQSSISLTAGDWDVWISTFFNSATATTLQLSGISTTSATLPDNSLLSSGTAGVPGISSGFIMQRVSLASTTTVYCVVFSTSAGSTVCGGIYARRVR